MKMKTVIIDNYDSFTYNLSHLVRELGAEVTVLRNDQFCLDEIEAHSKIILSPGPGIPSEAGLLLDVIRTYAGRKPILGVCLGHQAIGEVFGGKLENLSEVFHGVATPCHIVADDPIFKGLGRDITVGRYHSWVVSREGLESPRHPVPPGEHPHSPRKNHHPKLYRPMKEILSKLLNHEELTRKYSAKERKQRERT